MCLMTNVHHSNKFPKHLIFKIIEECDCDRQVIVSVYHHSKCRMKRFFLDFAHFLVILNFSLQAQLRRSRVTTGWSRCRKWV